MKESTERKLNNFLTLWIIIGWATLIIGGLSFFAGFVAGFNS